MAQSEVEPKVGQSFASWEEAETALNNYAKSKFFVWSVDTSNSIKAENKKLQGRGVPEAEWYNEALVHKNVKLCCTFGGKKRIGSGQGIRPMQSTFKTDCPVLVHLIAEKKKIVIKNINIGPHNHDCSKEIYSVLPKVRSQNLNQPNNVSTCNLLFKAGVKPSRVRPLLRGMGAGDITSRDLQNYRQKLRRESRGGLTPEQKLVEVLCELLEVDPSANIHHGTNEEGELTFIFIQTTHMRECMRKFGHILLLDHSHKVNKNRMPVSVLMTMDGHGNGRPVGYAFVANEQLVTIKEVLTAFKKSIGDEVAEKIKSVTVDKDYSEISALLQVFPNVTINLCDFHVSRTFNSKTHQEDPEVKNILTALRYCSQDEEFSQLVSNLKDIASENFYKYFEKNWLQCPLAWSRRDRKIVANLGNATNNRLESHNAKIKLMMNSDSELYESVQGILDVVRNKEEDVAYMSITQSIKQSYMTKCKHPEVSNTVVNDLTAFAAKLFMWELDQIPTDSEIERFHATTDVCSCPHACTYKELLPCRHVLTNRKKAGIAYDKSQISPMFWKATAISSALDEGRQKSSDPQISACIVPSRIMPKTHNERYTHSLNVAKMICSVLAECGEAQYAERHRCLKELLNLWSSGKEAKVVDAADFTEVQVFPINASLPDDVTAQTNSSGITTTTELPVVLACPACKNKDFPSGAHKCISCLKSVHVLPQCSLPVANEEESYGEKRLCITCAQKGKSISMLEDPRALDVPTASSNDSGKSIRMVEDQRALDVPTASSNDSGKSISMVEDQRPLDVPTASSNDSVKSTKPPPLCFCKIPCRRIMTSPFCKTPNRPLYKCFQFKCNFMQFAKKDPASGLPLSLSSSMVQISSAHSSELPIPEPLKDITELFGDGDDDENLSALIDLMDKDAESSSSITDEHLKLPPAASVEDNDNLAALMDFLDKDAESSSPITDEHLKLPPTASVEDNENLAALIDLMDNDTESSSPNTDEHLKLPPVASEDQPSKKTNETDSLAGQLRASLANFKLPQAVKHKGRAQGLVKTVVNHFSRKGTKTKQKKPKGAQMGTTKDDAAERQERAREISNDSVQPDTGSVSWTIKSQTSNGFYKVEFVPEPTGCSCSRASKICPHSLKCNCKDHFNRKLPCKHIYKIVAYIKEKDCDNSLSRSGDGSLSPCDADGNINPVNASKQKLFTPHLNGIQMNICGKDRVSCVVCQLVAIGSGTLCYVCKGVVHLEECSVPHLEKRTCLNCHCTVCKNPKLDDHICLCSVCQSPASPDIDAMCFKCERLAHVKCSKHVRGQGDFCLLCLKMSSETKRDTDTVMPWHKSLSFPDVEGRYDCKGLTITKFDFNSLRENSLLTDTVVDAFLLLMEDVMENEWVEVFTLPSQALLNISYGISSYLQALKDSPIVHNDIVIVPSHINGNHWVLFLVFMKAKEIFIIDSLHSSKLGIDVKEHLQILRYLISSSYLHCTQQSIDWDKWVVYYPQDFPRQKNSYDCGIFVCLFVYSIMTGAKLADRDFLPHESLQFRKWYTNYLLNHSIERVASVINIRDSAEDVPERAGDFYADARKAISDGTLIINKEWETVPPLQIKLKHDVPTLSHFADFMKHAFKATDKHCGTASGCRVRGTNRMFRCALCYEWMHLKCVGDQRKPPEEGSPYLCPLHQICHTKSRRNVQRPIRHRVSIG